MAKIVMCNVCGTTWDKDEECCCPQCGSVSATVEDVEEN
jgi:rubrerythrin